MKGEQQTRAIALLSSAGLGPKEIAETLGTTAGTVSVTLTSLKKKAQAKGAKAAAKAKAATGTP